MAKRASRKAARKPARPSAGRKRKSVTVELPVPKKGVYVVEVKSRKKPRIQLF